MTTPTNNPARAATVGDLAKFRANGQASIYGLAIQHPATVYTARINQTFSTLDEVVELTYDGGSGTLADVKEGMTVFIGTSAGARDKGVTVIRKTPSVTKFYIRPTSNIAFADNQYITIVDSFSLWSRPIYNKAGVIQMDTDIVFGDTTRGGIIPRLGPLAAVIQQESGTITFTPPNPSLSAGYDGATVASLVFSAPGALTTNNMTSATDAYWTYPLTADGEYRWSCAITDSLGRVTTAYRRVFVNPSAIPFEVNSPATGDFQTGDWSFEVSAYADVDDIYDRAMVVLFVKDYHGGVVDTIGKLAGFENLEAVGWIDGESIEQDTQTGLVSFTVHGPAFWMERVHIDPFELSDTFTTPTAWNQVEELTVDKALAHVLYWMTTAPLFMDCFFTGDTQRLRSIPMEGGSLWQLITSIASDRIFAKPACNNYGQLFVEIDQQIADSSARASFPVVMPITTADYEGRLQITRSKTEKTAMLQLSAIQDSDGVTDIFIHARAPGNVPANFGVMSAYENYVVEDSAECRRIAGRLLAVENNEYEPITLSFPSSNRLFDIAPRMVATITTDGSDNPRGIALTNQRLIPRFVTRTIGENGIPRTEVTFEVEVTGTDGVDYFPPTAEDPNIDFGLEEFGDLDFPGIDGFFPEAVPPEVTTPCNRAIGNYFTLPFSPRTLTGSTSTLIARAYFPCTVRQTGGTAGDTMIRISYHAFGDAESHKACYAVKDGNRVLTGAWSGNEITFSPVSDTEVDGFEIELDAGAGSVISRYQKGTKLIEEGAVGDDTTLCVDGQWYAIEPYQGYWTATFPPGVVGLNFYNVIIAPANTSYVSGVGLDGFGDFHLDYFGGYGSYAAPSNATETFNPSTQEFEYDPGRYGTIFFVAGVSQRTLRASSTLTLGLTYHNMRWRMYEAQAIGRQLVIGNATLYNVCALS